MTEKGTLAVALRLSNDAPEITRERVTEGDLAGIQSEVWLSACLRQGLDTPVDQMTLRIEPVPIEGRRRLGGFVVEATLPSGKTSRHSFTIRSLTAVAQRAARRLVAPGELSGEDLYYFELVEDPNREPAPGRTDDAGIVLDIRPVSLSMIEVPLAVVGQGGRKVGLPDDAVFPVFYTRDAYSRAQKLARKGERRNPPEETGAALIGPLCRCPDTGEIFAVVTDSLEVVDAEETKFSLAYSGRSWGRIQSVLDGMRRRPGGEAYRILGQAHGHNFIPLDGAPPCEVCEEREVCTRTSVFVSDDDLTWSQAVFHGQPWQLCHIFGLNARREHVQALYGLRDGRLLERPFQVIPEFVSSRVPERRSS